MHSSQTFWQHFDMPAPTPEHMPFKGPGTRNWRIDYAWPDIKIAVEIEGGVYKNGKDGQKGGRHNRPKGFINDMEKYNALASDGWTLLRYQPNKVDYDGIVNVYKKLEKMK